MMPPWLRSETDESGRSQRATTSAVQDRVNDARLQPSLGDTNDAKFAGGNVVVQLRALKRVVHELDVDVEDGETGSSVCR